MLRFATYAYPPNLLGYCGPEDSAAIAEYVTAGVTDGGLVRLEQAFEGAWPYLELIAAANGIPDPLDERVVEAYWVGNSLLPRVSLKALAEHLQTRFAGRLGRRVEQLLEPLPTGALPHHNFHVFGVYPWVGLLRSGIVEEPLRVLDRCRIRWGRVEGIGQGTALVRCRPLEWNGRELCLGPTRLEEVRALDSAVGRGTRGSSPLIPGDWVSLHWDWLCERLDLVELRGLRYYSAVQLTAVNAAAHPGPATVLA
jgi:hypothetical protein